MMMLFHSHSLLLCICSSGYIALLEAGEGSKAHINSEAILLYTIISGGYF